RIETQVGQVGHVDLALVTEPATRLVDEPILVVVDAHGTELAFTEVPDLVPVRRTLAGDQVHLVVAVQMHLVGRTTDLFALPELLDDVRIAGGSQQSRKPVEPGEDTVLDLAGRHLAWPADHGRRAEAALHDR